MLLLQVPTMTTMPGLACFVCAALPPNGSGAGNDFTDENPFANVGRAWKPTTARPRWPVDTESNVRREKRKLPSPTCVVCSGRGKVKCQPCRGRGRTNCTEVALLPKGEWPKWCWECHGSGLSYCSRCFGTGEKRGIIGFHIPDQDSVHQFSNN